MNCVNTSTRYTSLLLNLCYRHRGPVMRSSAPEPPVPADERERMDELQRYQVLDSEVEATFDRIVELGASMFNVPIALISLVDTSRQWFKSCYGLNTRQTPRRDAFCAHTIMSDSPSVLIVPDATKDVRFAQNVLVLGSPYIRFYAGAPLLSNGHKLGTVCLIDDKPRDDFGPSEVTNLQHLAAITVDLLSARLSSIDLKAASEENAARMHQLNVMNEELSSLIDSANAPIFAVDKQMRVRACLHANRSLPHPLLFPPKPLPFPPQPPALPLLHYSSPRTP